MRTRLKNRDEGGRLLACLLSHYARREDVVVLGVPPGGVHVAVAIAEELECAVDLLMVRTLNVPQHDPWQREIIMGAVAPGGLCVLDSGMLTSAKVHPQELEQVVAFEQQELERLQRLYRGDRSFPDLRGRTVVLETDAILVGSSMEAAIRAVRDKGAVRIVVATPVGLASVCGQLQRIADEFVCPLRSPDHCSLALWYDDPRYITDDEVRSLLAPALTR